MRVHRILDDAIESERTRVDRYQRGDKAILGFFVGTVLKQVPEADPQYVKEAAITKLVAAVHD